MPHRVQRKREAGWRMPPDTIYVGRPTQWGNPWGPDGFLNKRERVEAFERRARRFKQSDPDGFEVWIAPLRGMNLACWCDLDNLCHADVLLKLLEETSPPLHL